MRPYRLVLHNLLFSGVHTALVAVGASLVTTFTLALPLNSHLLLFTFAGTLVSYNLHWWLSPVAFFSTEGRAWSVACRHYRPYLMVVGTLLAGYALTQLTCATIWASLLAATATFFYTAPKLPLPQTAWLKKMAGAKTLYLTAVWTAVTIVLPLVESGVFDGRALAFILHRFFFIYALCLLFDMRDREQDRAAGIGSLATHVPQQAHPFVFFLLLAASCVPVLFLTNASVIHLVALLFSPIVLALLFYPARSTRSDVFYYLYLDGLLAAALVPYLINAAFR